MKVQYTVTEDDYVAFNFYYARNDPSFVRRVYLMQACGAAALIILGLFVGHLRGGITLEGMALFLIAAGLFVLYVPNQAKSTLEKRVLLTLDENRVQIPQGERTVLLLEDRLTIRDPSGEQYIPLEEIESTVRTKKHLFIMTKGKEVVVIPLSAFETPDDAQLFYSALPHNQTVD